MGLDNKQRVALINRRGQPSMTLEFDVWPDGSVSMWTHLKHGDDYDQVKQQFQATLSHLESFIKDGDMCPFKSQTVR